MHGDNRALIGISNKSKTSRLEHIFSWQKHKTKNQENTSNLVQTKAVHPRQNLIIERRIIHSLWEREWERERVTSRSITKTVVKTKRYCKIYDMVAWEEYLRGGPGKPTCLQSYSRIAPSRDQEEGWERKGGGRGARSVWEQIDQENL